MACRTAALSVDATGTLLDWVRREGADERTELAAQTSFGLAREGVPLRWTGSAAAELGLTGEADPATAAMVLEHGRGPKGERLRTAHKAPDGGERRVTYGMVLSADKTVSLLLMHPDSEVRETVRQAHEAAVREAVETMEAYLTVRRGAQGHTTEHVKGIAAVRASHYTSSAGDPHLHEHLIISASAPAQDGKWRALDSRVFFATQRIAEAAYQHRLGLELESRLGLSLSYRWDGSVATVEVVELAQYREAFSRAHAHMVDVAQEMERVLGSDRLSDLLVWQRHRSGKQALAEEIEHRLDAALAKGGEAGEALLSAWNERFLEAGGHWNLLTIRPAKEIDRPAYTPKQELEARLEQLRAMLPEAPTDRLEDLERWKAHAEKKLNELNAPLRWFLRKHDQEERIELEQRIRRYNEQIARAEKYPPRREIEQQIYQAKTALDKWTSVAEEVYQHLTNLNVWTPADVIAAFIPFYGPKNAPKVAADFITEYARAEKLFLADPERVAEVLRTLDRPARPTAEYQLALSHTSKGVTLEALYRENRIYEAARELCRAQRQPLLIDLQGLSAEQARAAAVVAKGRALTTIEGVAGSGKTYLLKPIVEAARRQGLEVRVVARNAELAHRLGQELNVTASTLAGLRQHTYRQTLLILDEAGLVDRRDWEKVMSLAGQTRVQVVALGDRQQAQPIDRMSTWATIREASIIEGTAAELSKSYRCQAWHDEHDLIREGNGSKAAEIAQKEGRVIKADPEMQWDAVADAVLTARQRGEDAIALTVSNSDAAIVSEIVQERLGIEIDDNTRLRWGQKCGIGDLVRTRLNDYALGVRNGELWRVVAIDDKHGLITVERDGQTVRLPRSYTQEHLELAYASTIDAAQGLTVDRAIVLTDGLTRSRAYSAVTRGRLPPIYVAPGGEREVAQAIAYDDIPQTAREIAAMVRSYRPPLEQELELGLDLSR